MFLAKGFCAGMPVFSKDVKSRDLEYFYSVVKETLNCGEYYIRFGLCAQEATEIVLDIYEKETGKYRIDLSRSFKK